MNTKRFIIASLATFVFVWVFEFILHGVILGPTYMATPHLWRPEEGYKEFMHFMLLSQITFAFVFVWIFTKHYENKGVAEGIRYGSYIGIIFATVEIGKYSYMPVELILPLSWAVSTVLLCIGCGVVTALLYKEK